MNTGILEELEKYKAENSLCDLKKRYNNIIGHIGNGKGCYIWGTGKLGEFCAAQMRERNISIKGFIDNDKNRWDASKRIYSPSCLLEDDVVIVASFYYPQIIEQLNIMGIDKAIYYEEFAHIVEDIATYYSAFEGIFEELEKNRYDYINIFNALEDDISKEVYNNLLKFRMTLNYAYTSEALELSLQQGIQDFDKLVVCNFTESTCFYDVGGYDGQTTVDFIHYAPDHGRIFFFEPDIKIIDEAATRLNKYQSIEYFPVAVGNRNKVVYYDNCGSGSGKICAGESRVKMVVLDDFISSSDSYIKIDVEGAELLVLEGCEQAIRNYKPMLSVSLYHKVGDIHTLIEKVLEYNPNYKVYMRHYTNTYADTRAYFINKE